MTIKKTGKPAKQLLTAVAKRPYHHGALREAMLEAAERILVREGIGGLTLRAAAREAGASGIWLGVNDENARANRFYDKSGFTIVGAKTFTLGSRVESDFVRERLLH